MKIGIRNKLTGLLIITGLMVSGVSFALNQRHLLATPSDWSIKHLKEGKTRLEVRHGDRTHYYEVHLTGVEIDGNPIELKEPKLRRVLFFVNKTRP